MELLHIFVSHFAFLFRYALIAYLLLNLFVRFLLPLFLPFSGSIGHFTPSSIHNAVVKWNGIKVEVKSLGVSVRRGGKAWFVLHGEGIKITVPRSTLLDLLSKPKQKKQTSTQENDKATPKPNSPSLLRRTFLPFFIRRLTHLISVNLDIDIDMEEVGIIRGQVKFGGQYKKPHLRVPIVGAPRQEDKLTLWASIENLSLTEPLRGLDQKEHREMLPAAEMREKITFRLSGPMGYEEWKNMEPRKGSMRASMEIEEKKHGLLAKLKRARQEDGEKKGLIIRIHEVKRLLRGLEEVQCELKCRRKERTDTESSSTPSNCSTTNPPPPSKPSPLVYFDSFSVSLPTIIFSLHYTTPLSILATSSPSVNETLPQTIAFAIILSGIKGSLKLKAMSDGEAVKDGHKAYLGKSTLCEVVGSIGWDELEGRIDVEGKEGHIASPSAKTLSIGRSEISLTSTWLPFSTTSTTPERPISKHTKKPRMALPGPSNYNDSIVMVEVAIGEVRGQTTFQTLDAAVRIFNARPRIPKRTPSGPASCPLGDKPKSKTLLSDIPQFVSSFTVASLEVRLVGPTPNASAVDRTQQLPKPSSFYPKGKREHPPYDGHHPFGRTPAHDSRSEEAHDSFFLPWKAPEILCIEVPRIVFTTRGEWADRSVKRKAADRSKAKRMERSAKLEAERIAKQERARREEARRREERDRDETDEEEYQEGSRTSRGNEERGREKSEERSKSRKPTLPNLAMNLDTHSHEYIVQSLLLVDTITIQILAVETASSEDSFSDNGASDSNSELIRLEVGSIGPSELSSKLEFLGYDSIDEEKDRYVPHLDITTCRGEHSFLLQTLQVELWRPVVLSCIHDILSSFASAAETSSRTRQRADSIASISSVDSSATARETPHPSPKPLVDILPSNQSLYFAIASTRFKLGGVDPKPKLRACRGIEVHSSAVFVEYILQKAYEPATVTNDVNRSKLELRPDFRSDANAMATAGGQAGKDDARQALINFSLFDLVVDPLVESRPNEHEEHEAEKKRNEQKAQSAKERERKKEDTKKRTADPELVGRAEVDGRSMPRRHSYNRKRDPLDHRDSLVIIPQLDFHVRIHKAEFNDQAADAGDSLDEIIIRLHSNSITLRLELFSIYLCLITYASLRWLRPTVHLSSTIPSSPSSKPKRPKPLLNFGANLQALHILPSLPHDTYLFVTFRYVVLRFTKPQGFSAKWDTGLLAGQSRIFKGKWEDIIRLQSTTISIRERENAGHHPFVVSITSDSARLRIPYRYVFNQIIDNAANLFKASKQLVHEHIKGRWDCIIEPTNEEPKHLPEIEINVGAFAIEFEDDPLERKLNMIWRVGYEEQKARLGRDKAFETKAEAVKREEERRRSAYGAGGDTPEDSSEEDDGGEKEENEERPKVTGRHTISTEDAKQILYAFNATQWIQRMKNASAEQARREEKLSKRLYGAKQYGTSRDLNLPIDLLPRSKAAPLGRAIFDSMRLSITKASFGENGISDHLFDVGKGLPRDTKFSLLVPIHLSWRFDEARFTVRDYPLPLLHVPRNHREGQPAWDWQGDFVVAEELGGPESVRRVQCSVIPPRYYAGSRKGFTITVPRSAMPVKTYTAPIIKVRSGEPIRIGWGNSVQPAIQDIARGIESMTKNSPDPSDRIGFWDKIRLAIHWRIAIDFVGDKASVIFHLKGSRDPHSLSGFGAGFAKAWIGDVKFRIGYDNPDHEFFQITSRIYILGIPNLREYIDSAATGTARETSTGSDGSIRTAESDEEEGEDLISEDMSAFAEPELEQAYWIKTCAKCVGGVRWGMGLRFERACREDTCDEVACKGHPTFERRCRFFDFIPHWEVKTKTLKTAPRDDKGELIDSFAGFRTDHLHFSISMTSPATLPLPNRDSPRDVDLDQVKPSIEAVGDSQSHNSFHFTPQAIAHFRRWWSLFDGTMSLPIRHGPVFPSTGTPSKKFGKHCATIKYRFSIAPLYISHTYAQESWAEWRRGETSGVGLKAKIGRFNVDLHQREQETVTRRDSEMEPKIVRHKAFYMAEVDLDSVDLRVITALFEEPEKASIPIPDEDEDEAEVSPPPATNFEGSPEDAEWVDLNDFNDSGHVFQDQDPRVRVFPFLVSPRFTYFRHVEAAPAQEGGQSPSSSEHPIQGPVKPTTKFGGEASHTCLMGRSTDTVEVQIREAGVRLVELQSELAAANETCRKELHSRIEVVERIIERLRRFRKEGHNSRVDDDAPPRDTSQDSDSQHESNHPGRFGTDDDDDARLPHLNDSLYRDWRDWTNRYVVHNPKIQISNDVRELLLKYYYSSRDRKAFVYHISAAAIKFIRDLDNQNERGRPDHQRSKSASQVKKDYEEAEEAKNRLLNDLSNGKTRDKYVKDELDQDSNAGDSLNLDPDSSGHDLPEDFESSASHLCMFISPQISLHSDADPQSTLIFTALRVNFKTFQVVDTRVPDDPVNYEVLHQNFATLDGLQAFYPRHHRDPAHGRAEAIFVPIETQLQPDVDSSSLERVVAPTSLRVRYDKFNHLLIHGDDKLGLKRGFKSFVDRINAEGDKFVITAKAEVYVAIFNILFRLLLQSDQQRQLRNAKVKALAFTHDFSNRVGVLRSVGERQEQIRSLIPEILEYQLHLDEIDETEKRNLFALRAQLTQLSEEISLFVEGLSLAQETNGPKTTSKRPGMQLQGRAAELTWTMLQPDSAPFVKASVTNVDFTWTTKDDGSATNRLIIGDLEALNPAPNALFSEIIKKANLPANEPQSNLAKANIFAVAGWDALAPVGGIPVVERFMLHLHPVALQLEHRVGRQILDYLFSERIKHGKEEITTEADRSRQSPQKSSKESPQKSKELFRSSYLASNQSLDSVASSSRRSTDQASSPTTSLHPQTASNSSLRSVETRLRKAVSKEVMSAASQEEGLDADEMRERAARYRAFLAIEISCTVLRLTYRSEEDDHSLIPNVYNVICRTPNITFSSKTTSFSGLVDDIKSEMIKSLWSQKGKLIGQILSRAHRTLPLQEQRSAVSTKVKSKLRNPLRLRRRTKQIAPTIAPSQSNANLQASSLTSPLHLTNSSESSASSSSTSSRRMELEDEHFAEEGIKLMDPSAEFTAEPDQGSIDDFYERRRQLDTNSSSPRSHASPQSAKSSLKETSSTAASRSTSMSSGLPPVSEISRSSSSQQGSSRHPEMSFPFHRPLREPSSMSEDQKRAMLLGADR